MMSAANEDLFHKIVKSYYTEFIKSMKIDVEETTDLLISFADLTVWYYNHDCQHTLKEIRQVWDKVQSTQFGTKSLKSFFTNLTEELFKSHKVLLSKIKTSKEIKKYLESTKEVSLSLGSKNFSKDPDQEFFTSQTNISYLKEDELDSSSVLIHLSLNFAELTDLRSAFCEGFSGFYLEASSKSSSFSTIPVDVNGNQAIWMSEFNLKFSLKDKIIKISLFEVIHGTAKKIAKFKLDALRYVLKNQEIENIKSREGQFLIGGKEKYEIMDSLDVSSQDATKIGFSVSVLSNSPEGLADWISRRSSFLKDQLMKTVKEIDEINIKLVQYTAGFKTVCFDNSRIFTVSETQEGICCFSPSAKKKKRSCLII